MVGMVPLSWRGSVFELVDVVSPAEVRELRRVADEMFGRDLGWRKQAYLISGALFTPGEPGVPPILPILEERVPNLTGLAMATAWRRDEAGHPVSIDQPGELPLTFTRHRPGSTPHRASNIHHDKNGGVASERRVVTLILYLSTSRSDAEGGHTIFPMLPPRGVVSPLEPSWMVDGPADDDTNSADGSVRRLVGTTGSVGRMLDGDEPPATLQELSETLESAFARGEREFTRERSCLGRTCMVEEAALLPAGHDAALGRVEMECSRALSNRSRVLAVRPRAGSALLVWHVQPDGSPNTRAWHSACTPPAGGRPRYAVQKFKAGPLGTAREDAVLPSPHDVRPALVK